jgi:hypothetical protein
MAQRPGGGLGLVVGADLRVEVGTAPHDGARAEVARFVETPYHSLQLPLGPLTMPPGVDLQHALSANRR